MLKIRKEKSTTELGIRELLARIMEGFAERTRRETTLYSRYGSLATDPAWTLQHQHKVKNVGELLLRADNQKTRKIIR